jgi:acetyl-CoA carboxylase biotin carboxyl carrier protein
MNDKPKRPEEPEGAAPGGRIDFDEIRKVIALLEEKNLSVFELEIEGFKVKITRNLPAPAAPPASANSAPASGPSTAGEAAAPLPVPGSEHDETLQMITSPMVGTFYRAPDPTAPPFVDIGDPVKKGQTLCIVEAMKLMNEIESELDGTVVEVFVENAKPVEFGQKLFAIKPLS